MPAAQHNTFGDAADYPFPWHDKSVDHIFNTPVFTDAQRAAIVPVPAHTTTAHAADWAHAHGARARLTWARLLKRVFDLEVERCGCGDAYEKDPNSLGPNVRTNYEMGAGMTMADVCWAHVEQTRIFRRFQQTFRDFDLELAPTAPVSPFPWQQLYLEAMDGKKRRNYYHWLSLTYVITLVTNPAIAIPCGTDHQGMPFGLQVVGRVPRRPRAARRRARIGAGVCRGAHAAAPRAGFGQARADHPGAEIHRDASARAT